MAGEPQGFSCLHLLVASITSVSHNYSFFTWMLGPQANTGSILLPELYSQSLSYQLLNQQWSVSGETTKTGNADSISSYNGWVLGKVFK